MSDVKHKGLVGGTLEGAEAFIRGLLSAESFDRQALDGLHVSFIGKKSFARGVPTRMGSKRSLCMPPHHTTHTRARSLSRLSHHV